MDNTAVTTLTSSNFDTFINNKAVVVDFWAPWCGPCRALKPILESVANKVRGDVVIGAVNVDDDGAQAIASKYSVRSIPTLVFLKAGKVVDTSVGMMSEADLLKKIEATFKTE